MPRRPQPPVFLARATYRQRRLRDSLRLVPVLGAVLWLVPLLWTRAGDVAPGDLTPGDLTPGDVTLADTAQAMSNSTALVYVFGVWLVLIGLVWALSRFLNDDTAAADPEDAG